jgi:uncharacterized membrane protein
VLRDLMFSRSKGDGIRWRGDQVSRLEGFSDAAFGFAVTLVVISLQVPATVGELVTAMRGLPAFITTMLVLMSAWWQHYVYFRRYGLSDRATVFLNTLLLLVVLFYVYPLKFMFTVAFAALAGTQVAVRSAEELRTLSIIFAAGFAAVTAMFGLLYVHAWRRRVDLGLDAAEIAITRAAAEIYGLNVLVILAVIGVELVVPPWRAAMVQFGFFGMFFTRRLHRRLCRRRQLQAS